MRGPFVFAAHSLPVFALALTLAAQQPVSTKPSDASAEQAIKAKIEAETKAYYDGNLKGLKSGWVEDERASRIVVSRANYIRIAGWTKIADWYTQSLSGREADWSTTPFSNTNYVVTIKDNMAWVEYDQTTRFTENGNEVSSKSRELRTLVHENGLWKFLSMTTIGVDSYDNSFQALQSSVNFVGYQMLQQGKIDQAIDVFQLNTRLYPQSANVYDSLGEAYLKAGKKDLAIQNYQKSLELDAQNKNAEKMLTQLKAE
jgi:tetratricopeptide (TPR) repeat protein